MSGFFNVENPFFQTLNKVIDTVAISFIWCLFLIPMVFTGRVVMNEGPYLLFLLLFVISTIPVGPAITALYYTMVKVIRRERGYAMREFFHSFKINFKQGALASLIFGLMAAILFFDYNYVDPANLTDPTTFQNVLLVGFNAVAILMVFIGLYIFPVLSRFSLSTKLLFRNALFMSVRHIPSTLLMILINAVGVLLVYLLWPLPVFSFIPGACSLLSSLLMERIFKKYMPVPEDTDEEAGEDRWYLE